MSPRFASGVAVVALLATWEVQASLVTVSNAVPRRDNFNAILDAHDSKLNLFEGVYYWHAASYGNCSEPKGASGCGPPIGGCGFQTDHNVSLYTSTDFVNWVNEGVVFGAQGNLPPDSVLFAPKTVYNAQSKTWVVSISYTPTSKPQRRTWRY